MKQKIVFSCNLLHVKVCSHHFVRLFALISFLHASFSLGHQAAHSVQMHERSGGTFYVSARLADELEVQLLMDTGASMLTINRQTFRQLNQKGDLYYVRDMGFKTARGKVVKVKVYQLSSLTLGNSCTIENVEVAVIPSGTNILGMNVLSHLAPFGLSVQPAALHLSNCHTMLAASD